VTPCFAQRRPRRPLAKKIRPSYSSLTQESNSFSLSTAVDDILNSETDTSFDDSLTIKNLSRLKEEAQPSWNPDDIDTDQTRRVVEKAFAIQSARSLNVLIKRSDVGDYYRDVIKGVKGIQKLFRYSLQSDGSSVTVSKKRKGSKLLELNLQFNVNQGVDPQITIGDAMRFRYDYVYNRPMLEYGFDF